MKFKMPILLLCASTQLAAVKVYNGTKWPLDVAIVQVNMQDPSGRPSIDYQNSTSKGQPKRSGAITVYTIAPKYVGNIPRPSFTQKRETLLLFSPDQGEVAAAIQHNEVTAVSYYHVGQTKTKVYLGCHPISAAVTKAGKTFIVNPKVDVYPNFKEFIYVARNCFNELYTVKKESEFTPGTMGEQLIAMPVPLT